MFWSKYKSLMMMSGFVSVVALTAGFGLESPDPTHPLPAEPLIIFKTIGIVAGVYTLLLINIWLSWARQA